MKINVKTEIIRNNNAIAKKVKGDFIVIDVNKGALYRLNPTAQAIWKQTKVHKSVAQIIKEVTADFSVDKKRAEKETIQFIKRYLNSLFFIAQK